MKKFVVLVVLLCAVMISSTTSAATMANWVFVKDFTIKVPYKQKYTLTPDQFYDQEYQKFRLQGLSMSDARELAGRKARQYKYEYEAEQMRLQNPLTYKLSSYIDANSVVAEQTADNSVAFFVVAKEIYSPAAGIYASALLRENNKPVPEGLETLSFIVRKIHFKSPDGITKYYTESDCVAFTSFGKQIKELSLTNAPLNWKFISPGENLDAIFDAAYKLLR